MVVINHSFQQDFPLQTIHFGISMDIPIHRNLHMFTSTAVLNVFLGQCSAVNLHIRHLSDNLAWDTTVPTSKKSPKGKPSNQALLSLDWSTGKLEPETPETPIFNGKNRWFPVVLHDFTNPIH